MICSHLGSLQIYLGSNAPRIYREPTYFSQIPKSELNDVKFPSDSTLAQYVDDLCLCSQASFSPQGHTIYLLQWHAVNGVQGLRGQASMLFAQVHHLGHLTPTDGLLVNPERLRGILPPLPRAQRQRRGSIWFIGYCHNGFQFFINGSASVCPMAIRST